jgi:hypothetical protein
VIRTHHPSKKKKRKCHPERSIRISARSLLSALNHFRSVSKDLHFPARTTPHLKGKRKPSHPERSIRISARRFWRAESIQKRVEGPAFLSSPKTNPTCPILARLCRAIGSNTAALNRPQHFSTNQNCHPERSAAPAPSSGASCKPARSRRTPRSNGNLREVGSEREGNRAHGDRQKLKRGQGTVSP